MLILWGLHGSLRIMMMKMNVVTWATLSLIGRRFCCRNWYLSFCRSVLKEAVKSSLVVTIKLSACQSRRERAIEQVSKIILQSGRGEGREWMRERRRCDFCRRYWTSTYYCQNHLRCSAMRLSQIYTNDTHPFFSENVWVFQRQLLQNRAILSKNDANQFLLQK